MLNYYEILGVADFSAPEVVRKAHRMLSKQHHPDLNNGDKFHEERFKEIQHAYEQLRNPDQKAAFDTRLRYYYSIRDHHQYTGQESYHQYAPPPQPDSSYTPTGKGQSPVMAIVFFLIFFSLLKIFLAQPWDDNAPPPRQAPFKFQTSEPLFSPENKTPEASQEQSVFQREASPFQPTTTAFPALKDTTVVQKTFRTGSSRDAVRAAQGAPEWVTIHNGSEMWTYGNSVVIFKNNAVDSYHNIGRNLHVEN